MTANHGPRVLVLPVALVLVVDLVLILSHGGFGATAWYPAGLFLLALLAVLLATGVAGAVAWHGRFRLALAAYGLYIVWAYLSIAWADVPGLAWDGANRSLVYWLVLAIAGLRRWTPGELRIALGAVTAMCALVAIGVLVAASGSHPENLFVAGRLADPMGYANATPNLWLIGCFPGLWLAMDRRVVWWARGAALGAVALLAQMSLLSQSRGAIVAFGLVALVFVVAAPRRWVALGGIVATVGIVLATSGPVLAVHDAMASAEIGPLLRDARTAILLGALGLTLVGAAFAFADTRLERDGRLGVNTRRGNLALAGFALAGLIALLVVIGNPATWADRRWQDFKSSGYEQVDRPGQSRLTGSLGSQRYDIYRVALNEFADHPVTGVGVDSYGPGYLLHGQTDLNPRYAHSLAMSLLAETGIVGAALFLAFLALIASRLVSVARHRPEVHGPVLGAAAGAGMFLGGALFDWLWQFPALGILGFLLLGMGANVAVAEPTDAPRPVELPTIPSPPAWRLAPLLPRLAVGVALLAVALSLIAPGIAARFTAAAYESSATDPHLTVQRLDRAADLDPLSAAPLLAKNVVLRRLGDIAGAQHALDAAEEREPENWFIPFERALLEAQLGQWSDAVADLVRAQALNPRQVVIGHVLRASRHQRVYGAQRAEEELAIQTTRKLQPTG